MIYSITIFILLVMRNYFEKNELVLIDSLIIQVLVLLAFKMNIGLYGVVFCILIMGYKIRRLQLGNKDGDRRY